MSDFASGGCLLSEMQTKTDSQLLREYAGNSSEAAFGELVSRHADLVYSAALRQVIEPDFARDVAQNVFADLARKAKSLSGNIVLAGWLLQVMASLRISGNSERDRFFGGRGVACGTKTEFFRRLVRRSNCCAP